MLILGLTGNIATGKSRVASMFSELGGRIIDADIVARDVVKPGSPAWKEIVDHFGDGILNKDRTINRKALGEVVFKDDSRRKRLNEITHPRIIEAIRDKLQELENQNAEIVLIEAALIVEKGGMKDIIDKLVVVKAGEEEQIERLRERDELKTGDALNRIRSQMPISEKVKYADYVIDNSGTLENTRKQVRDIMNELASLNN